MKQSIKKIVVFMVVVFGFVAYILYQQQGNSASQNIYVTPPKNTPINNQPNPSTGNNFGTPDSTPSTSSGQATPTPTQSTALYKDGSFIGDVADAFYGNVQVKAVISGGKITDVQFLDYPQDRSTSREINSQAMPWLKSEAISAQSANVDIISGATATSDAFIESLRSALLRAKA